ncbi:MAG: hypothetical protein PV354_05630, partial [Bartonella sp.]|nr:hypothetical protein [Bartonella sp.]
GFNTPLIMSFVALSGGALLYILGHHYFLLCDEGVPLFRSLKRLRIFERIFMIIFWKWPCVAESFLSTRRLQVQLCWV